MAGPWFTVHRSQGDWKTLGQVWISNGESDSKGEIQMKVSFEKEEDFTPLTSISPIGG